MEKYKSKFTESEGPRVNDFVISFSDSGDSSVGISPRSDEIFVVFRYGDWMPDFIEGLKEDIVNWCKDISEGKLEYKIRPLNENSGVQRVLSKIPEDLPGQYEDDGDIVS
jgi:hypothetical protein